MPRTWKPTPTIQLSIATHLAAGLSLLAAPAHWPWALGALAANQALLTAAGLLPRCSLLGPNLTRLPRAATERREIVLTFDDGPDPEVTPRVLDLLDVAGVKASFFCIGRYARQHPAICRDIIRRGHTVENHGDSHSWAFAAFGRGRIRADIGDAQKSLADITGQKPDFFRPTAGLRNPLLEPVLAELDLHLATWTRRPYDTQNGKPETILRRLTHQLGPGDILLMHDGHAAATPTGEPVVLAILPHLLESIRTHRLNTVTLTAALT